MEDGERMNGDRLAGAMRVKKQGLLNKFLTKTYHMIDTCDTSVASWSIQGDSFIIKDVEEFSKTVLPRFFKHSKFPSFVRQLNFYSFRKLRPAPEARLSATKSVRFAHEFFRKGQPELLHRIQRITKSQDVCSGEVKCLKDEIADISEELNSFSCRMDQRFRNIKSTVELDYQQRMANITLSYQVLSNLSMSLATAPTSPQPLRATSDSMPNPTTAPITPPHASLSPPPAAVLKSVEIEKPVSPTSVSAVSPLMALSMVATMDRQQEFNCT